MNNVEYSFIQEEKSESLTFQSKVNSFGVEHVTKKSLTSFYMNFSKKGFFDTGLLPVDGSGILSIRTAGPHTQIGYQHKPGMYYINWGGYENDPNAQKIYVAQPYRIVIADIYNDNVLGARTFYSPVPITYPDAPLYHVNLPNINCLGYRGNGVGWICLYHNEDISHYPFNEKVAKVLDRCSGTEAYNDANMSETDGPRIYRSNSKPTHLYIPSEWEKFSDKNGVDWTLDPDLWIPVLVQDADNQDQHYPEGIPLTYGMAVTGNYQAYYTDPIKPKPVNALARPDLVLDESEIFNWFKQSYNSSHQSFDKKESIFDSSLKVREAQSVAPPVFSDQSDSDEPFENEIDFTCASCNSTYYDSDSCNHVIIYDNVIVCEPCFESGDLAYVDHIDNYVLDNHPYLAFIEETEKYYLTNVWNQYIKCNDCNRKFIYDKASGYPYQCLPLYKIVNAVNNDIFGPDPVRCIQCFASNLISKCAKCNDRIPHPYLSNGYVHSLNIVKIVDSNIELCKDYVCNHCYFEDSSVQERNFDLTTTSEVYCSCGKCLPVNEFLPAKTLNGGNLIGFGYNARLFLLSQNENIDKLLTLFKSYIENNISTKSNIISNVTSFISKYPEGIPNANIGQNIFIQSEYFCSECANHFSGHNSYASLQNAYNKYVQEFIVPTMLDQQKLENIFGTKILVF